MQYNVLFSVVYFLFNIRLGEYNEETSNYKVGNELLNRRKFGWDQLAFNCSHSVSLQKFAIGLAYLIKEVFVSRNVDKYHCLNFPVRKYILIILRLFHPILC